MFVDVITEFEKQFGYVPVFITVITPDNIDRALDHLRLAKKLNTKVKLNGLAPVGKSTESVPLYKMVDVWDSIYKAGLEQYMSDGPHMTDGGCNFNTAHMCKSTIRAAWVDNNDKLQYSFCETCMEGVHPVGSITIERDKVRPEPTAIYPTAVDMITPQCPACDLCDFCNGCIVARTVAKCDESYCTEIKARRDKIFAHGWAIDRNSAKLKPFM